MRITAALFVGAVLLLGPNPAHAQQRVDRFPVPSASVAPALDARFPDDSSYWREGAIVGGVISAVVVGIAILTTECESDVQEVCHMLAGPMLVASVVIISGGALVGGIIGAFIPRD